MMGSRSHVPVGAYYTDEEKYFSEPEEYDLDTYTVPVDTTSVCLYKTTIKNCRLDRSVVDPSSRISQTKKSSLCNGIKFSTGFELNGVGIDSDLDLTNKEHYTRSDLTGSKLIPHSGTTSNLAGTRASLHHCVTSDHIEGNPTFHLCTTSDITGSKLTPYTYKCLASSNKNANKSLGNSKANRTAKENQTLYWTEIFHHDPVVCSCCACHVLAKKGGERLYRAHQPRSGFAGATMGDLDGRMGMGNARGGRRSGHHQPTFLKTVSIIETLSELGPEVRQLAEEPHPPPPSKPASCSRTSKQAPHATAIATTAAEYCSSREAARPHGPPIVSPDFQQYTEEIYDAVTRRSFPTKRAKTSKSRSSNLKVERLKKTRVTTGISDENGLPVRLKDGDHVRRFRQRERGRTPDWIKRIFEIAKKGDLEALKQSIVDMEETLVRNLSDHAGNNLLHVMCVYGHLASMAWLLSTQSVMVDALQDENKYGLTPLVCSIKYGRLHVVQWLVENTSVKDKVKCKDGERSLLHIAAKYAQEEIVAWLVDYMMTHQISLDNKDHHGNTALHLVARTGNTRVSSILLQHGADVTLKNDLGQKSWEVCVIRRHLACAEYLCVHETGLALANDLTRREAELEAAMVDNHDLRINFKEVMSMARRLLREREEAVRELSRLHEQIAEAHDTILTLHVLSDDASSTVREQQLNGLRQAQHQREQIETVVAYVASLQERWQTLQKSWFGSSLVNMRHKMFLIEEAWKKLRHRSHRTVATTHHPLDVFRGKLSEVRAQGGEGRLGDLPSLCSSEESLASLFPFTDDENEDSNYEQLPSSSTPARESAMLKSIPGKFKLDDSAYSSSGNNELDHLVGSSLEFTTPTSPNLGLSQNRPYWTDNNLSTSLSRITELSPRDELNSRLKDLALTSESGSCSVLEVIEPSSEESDNHIEEGNRSEQANSERLIDDAVIATKFSGSQEHKGKYEVPPRGEVTLSESAAECLSSVDLMHSIDISSHGYEGKHFLVSETSVGAAAADVSEKMQRPSEQSEGNDHGVGHGVNFKRKGFLQKLIKPSRWPPKKKGINVRKIEPEISRDIFDTYTHRNDIRSIETAPIDADPQTTPESNTSSSQEYSNSSEESSIGKPSSRTMEYHQLYNPHVDSEIKPVLVASNTTGDKEKVSEHSQIIQLTQINQPLTNTPPPVPSRRAILSPTSSENCITTQGYPSDRRSEIPIKTPVSEVRSVSASEDSGIVARPSSSASKSESISRPESSSSSFPPFKTEYALRKSNLSLTQDMLPTPDSSTAGRMSPAPSEVSKTESALSPPSHASDVSKSASSRQTSMGKGSLGSSANSNCSKNGSAGSADYSVSLLPLKKELNVKKAEIINIPCDQDVKTHLQESMSQSSTEDLQNKKKERPWYELSDEESDILLPDRLTPKVILRHSSSEDETEIC